MESIKWQYKKVAVGWTLLEQSFRTKELKRNF